MLSGDNGILQKATDAKTQTGIGQEKETIALAYNSALAKKVSNGNSSAVTDSELNDELDSLEAIASGNPIIVTFTKSGNTYEIDSQGIIKLSTPKDPNATLKVSEHKNEKFSTNTELEDNFGNKITVPAGFKITSDSPNSVTGGIVIEDVDAGTETTEGSQFVWIAVGDVYTNTNGTKVNIKLGRYIFDENGVPSELGVLSVSIVKSIISSMQSQEQVDQDLGSGAYVELSALTNKSDSEIQSWINEGGTVEQRLENMMSRGYSEETISREGSSTQNATAKNLSEFLTKASKGFYIGRYEARVEGATLDTTGWGNGLQAPSANWTGYTNGKLVEKGNAQVFNYITQSKASELSRGMYTSSDFESDLVNSYAWDTATLFLQEFGEEKYSIKTSVNKSLVNNGTSATDYTGTRDSVCNVYDMASNCCEWTTETYDYDASQPCLLRGTYYYVEVFNTSTRFLGSPYLAYEDLSFRPILYVK